MITKLQGLITGGIEEIARKLIVGLFWIDWKEGRSSAQSGQLSDAEVRDT